MRLSPFLLTSLAMLVMASQRASAGVGVVYDFADRYSDAQVSNTMASRAGQLTAGGVRKPGFTLHPTDKEATAAYKLALPTIAPGELLILTFSAGMGDGLKTDDPDHPFDGVKFSVRVNGKETFAADLKETKWIDGAVDLSASAGEQIEVVFATDSKENTNYDWAAWGEPRILRLSKNVPASGGRIPAVSGIAVIRAQGGNASVRITPLNSAGKQISSGMLAQLGTQKLAAARFDFSGVGADSVSVSASGAASVSVFELEPELDVVAFGPSNALLFADTPAEIRCIIKNFGEGALKASAGAKATLSGNFAPIPKPAGKSKSAKPTKPGPPVPVSIGALKPGESKTLTWPGLRAPAQSPSASVEITGRGLLKMTVRWNGAVAKMPAAMPSKVEKPEAIRLSDGTIVLQNPKLRITFVRDKDGYIGWTASIPKGDAWQIVATGPLGALVAQEASSGMNSCRPRPKDAKLSNEPFKRPAVSLTATKKVGSADCRFEWLFTLNFEKPEVEMLHSMNSRQQVRILRFSGPVMYAGDRGFGKARDEGLFPGLEYLLSESSSGTENVNPPANLRTVPHPNKITIPFMAIRKGPTLVSLEWDPLQKWDGVADRPAALFASPNFLDGQDNHAMGLFAPSVPQWTSENETTASKPYVLDPGKTLSLKATLVVKSDSTTILDAVDGWIARHDIPNAPAPTMSPEGWTKFWDDTFFETAYDDTVKGWKPTNTDPAYFDPMIATCYWDLVHYLRDDTEQRDRIMKVLGPATEKAKGQLTPEIALFTGGVEPAMKRMRDGVYQLIGTQRPDGSWPFAPDAKHAILGRTGDTSSGHTANNAVTVLRYALYSCDPKACEAGLKALNYLDTQVRPEGSQTWELQLHVPDILAAGRLVDAYLSGYILTKDKKYLDRAVHFAKSGLPFVYMWNAPDRPIMRYGTIPVFGATWFDGQPWFGVCVQWCGLDYAYWIARLGEYDDSLPWAKIADGIMQCAIQQQEYAAAKYPAEKGMFPDAFSVITGEEAYHWNLNPKLIIRLALNLMVGHDAFPRTQVATDKFGNYLSFTAPANNLKMYRDGEFLKARCEPIPGTTIYAMLGNVYMPISIGTPDRSIPGVGNVETVNEGFQYFEDSQLTVLKLKALRIPELTIDLMLHVGHYASLAEKDKKPAEPK